MKGKRKKSKRRVLPPRPPDFNVDSKVIGNRKAGKFCRGSVLVEFSGTPPLGMMETPYMLCCDNHPLNYKGKLSNRKQYKENSPLTVVEEAMI